MEDEAGNETLEEELERFDDFTLASSWERFISEIEAACRLWLACGPKNLLEKGAVCLGSRRNLYKVTFDVKYSTKSYCLEYFFENSSSGKILNWDNGLHDFQLSFGVKEFLVIAPLSASGVVLDAPEATKLLSSVAIALSNCGSMFPAFVPVHDPSRKAYIGIQNMGTVLTRRFEADLIGSQVPVRLMHLEGLYELFISKFSLSTVDFSASCFQVNFTMKLTYRTPPNDDEDDMQEADSEITESERNPESGTHSKTQWDDDCPWAEWYSSEDPVKGFELITIWSNKMVESSMEMAEIENASCHEAEKWLLSPILSPNLVDDSKENAVGFASQLRLLVDAFDVSFQGQFIEDFMSDEKLGQDSMKSSATVPPPTVLDRVLRDLFHEGVAISDYAKGEHKNSRAIKGAPLESLFAQFCLHCLWFGDCKIRAIGMLWIEFVREVRWCWEESQPIPKMLTHGTIDLSTCLIHQKLQMLAICIEKKRPSDHILEETVDKNYHVSASNEEESHVWMDSMQNQVSTEQFDAERDSSLRPVDLYGSGTKLNNSPDNLAASDDLRPLELIKRGSAGVVGSMMLLNSYQRMHAPYTQDAPIMTEDMHEERLRAFEALGNAFSFSGQLEKDILSSDMSAFKAANPGAVFEDFIRWHSPGDWETAEREYMEGSTDKKVEDLRNDWPPRGRLSKRMSEHGNSWRQIWNDVPVLPASEQKPLLDPNREGEKVLHYLETIRPHQLLAQIVCTGFRASADSLNQTSYGDLKQMKTKIGQVYLTMASTLKVLQANDFSDKVELIDDLRRLCVVFEHVEKLVILAASIHRKLSVVPRLSKAIFNDCFNWYLPRMGTSSSDDKNQKELDVKEKVGMQERQAVENLFTPPTANQSWRKVLSMGNLLNGHEPILREIIFSTHDSMSGSHSGGWTSGISNQDIETHRMYICGTSNDLRVALSVTSSDYTY